VSSLSLSQSKAEAEAKISTLNRKLVSLQAHLNRDKAELQEETKDLRRALLLATVSHYYRERHTWLRCGRCVRNWQIRVARDGAAIRSTKMVNFYRHNLEATCALREAESRVRERKHAMEANRERDRWWCNPILTHFNST